MILPKATARAIQAAEAKDNRLPSPPSKLIGDRWVNVCPACLRKNPPVLQPCSTFPWSCPVCGWTAAPDPRGCCTQVHDVTPDPKDSKLASYPVTVAEIEAAKAATKPTEKQKAIAALSTATADVGAEAPAPKEVVR
jgi:hypothetical protein